MAAAAMQRHDERRRRLRVKVLRHEQRPAAALAAAVAEMGDARLRPGGPGEPRQASLVAARRGLEKELADRRQHGRERIEIFERRGAGARAPQRLLHVACSAGNLHARQCVERRVGAAGKCLFRAAEPCRPGGFLQRRAGIAESIGERGEHGPEPLQTLRMEVAGGEFKAVQRVQQRRQDAGYRIDKAVVLVCHGHAR